MSFSCVQERRPAVLQAGDMTLADLGRGSSLRLPSLTTQASFPIFHPTSADSKEQLARCDAGSLASGIVR